MEDGLLWHTKHINEQEEISKLMNEKIEFISDTCNQYTALQISQFVPRWDKNNAENNIVLQFKNTYNYIKAQYSEIKYYYKQFQKLFGNDQTLYKNLRNKYKKIINDYKNLLPICDAIDLEILQKERRKQ